MRIRSDGGSAAARQYAGREGRVIAIIPGPAKVALFVRIECNYYIETTFEEWDLAKLDDGEL